jgi:hypothetical protein
MNLLRRRPRQCLLLHFLLFGPRPSYRLRKGNEQLLFQEKATVRRLVLDQKLLLAIFVEVFSLKIIKFRCIIHHLICIARKTKCDGAHPACASCARRQLDCNYVHDAVASNGSQRRLRQSSTSKNPVDPPLPRSVSPPSSRMVPTPSSANDARDMREGDVNPKEEVDLKRPLEYSDANRAPKKMRMDSPGVAGIP